MNSAGDKGLPHQRRGGMKKIIFMIQKECFNSRVKSKFLVLINMQHCRITQVWRKRQDKRFQIPMVGGQFDGWWRQVRIKQEREPGRASQRLRGFNPAAQVISDSPGLVGLEL
jgi:hypothetical protein